MISALTIFQIVNPVLPSGGALDIGRIISAIVGLFLVVGFILALFHIIFGAVAWVTSAGDKNKLQQAQERITSAIIGLILLVAVWAIMLLIGTFLGFGFPKFTVPTFVTAGGEGDGGGGGGENGGICTTGCGCVTSGYAPVGTRASFDGSTTNCYLCTGPDAHYSYVHWDSVGGTCPAVITCGACP